MSELDTPLSLRLPAPTARKLAKAGFETVEDLLLCAPRRYYHWGALTPMSMLHEGEDVTILAQVARANLVANRSRQGVRLEVQLTDSMTTMNATFFAHNEYKLAVHQRLLKPGASFLFAGKVGSYRGTLSLVHPSFEGMDDASDSAEERSQRPIPIYPTSGGITSWIMARSISMILDSLDDESIDDVIPADIREQRKLPNRATALRMLHQPSTDDDYKQAKTTFAFEEAFTLQCILAGRRYGERSLVAPACPLTSSHAVSEFIASLPFTLTDAQSRALKEIDADMNQTVPMQRLLQGDVGSGKTVVALAALIAAVDAGHQGALVAPTEVLAGQHLESMRALAQGVMVDGKPVDIRLLTGSTPPGARREMSALIEAGEPLIVVGTHALFSDSVAFNNLGVVIVDEQHRFGVEQRDTLRTSGGGRSAHQLVMTATPIPRTVAMTVFGDLEETRMAGMPAGRTPVQTFLVDSANSVWMERLWTRAHEEIERGGRVYVVCPRIDETDEVTDAEGEGANRPPLASVEKVSQTLRRLPALGAHRIETLTGRTPPAEKIQIMERFASGESPILVSTTVIEVGVDVKSATMMVIVDAQQFGLAQLHQLRGRVGRSSTPSVTMAVHRSDLNPDSMERLEAFASTTDGFELAEKDVQLRREGDVLGAGQSGRSSHLRFLSVRRDERIISHARSDALRIIEEDPKLMNHPELACALRRLSADSLAWISMS